MEDPEFNLICRHLPALSFLPVNKVRIKKNYITLTFFLILLFILLLSNISESCNVNDIIRGNLKFFKYINIFFR